MLLWTIINLCMISIRMNLLPSTLLHLLMLSCIKLNCPLILLPNLMLSPIHSQLKKFAPLSTNYLSVNPLQMIDSQMSCYHFCTFNETISGEY